MCKINEEMLEKEARRTSIKIAKNLLKQGLGKVADISNATGLSIDEVKTLAKEINPSAL